MRRSIALFIQNEITHVCTIRLELAAPYATPWGYPECQRAKANSLLVAIPNVGAD